MEEKRTKGKKDTLVGIRHQDGKQSKKRKAPRYWANQKEDTDCLEDGRVKENKNNVEEITIDPVVLEKYTRGKSVNVKVLTAVESIVHHFVFYITKNSLC